MYRRYINISELEGDPNRQLNVAITTNDDEHHIWSFVLTKQEIIDNFPLQQKVIIDNRMIFYVFDWKLPETEKVIKFLKIKANKETDDWFKRVAESEAKYKKNKQNKN